MAVFGNNEIVIIGWANKKSAVIKTKVKKTR